MQGTAKILVLLILFLVIAVMLYEEYKDDL